MFVCIRVPAVVEEYWLYFGRRILSKLHYLDEVLINQEKVKLHPPFIMMFEH